MDRTLGRRICGQKSLLDIIIDPLFEAPADHPDVPSVADKEEQERAGFFMRLRARTEAHPIGGVGEAAQDQVGGKLGRDGPPLARVAAEPDFDGLVFAQNPRDQAEGFRIVIDHKYA